MINKSRIKKSPFFCINSGHQVLARLSLYEKVMIEEDYISLQDKLFINLKHNSHATHRLNCDAIISGQVFSQSRNKNIHTSA